MNKTVTFKMGACFTGDVIYALSGIKNYCDRNDVKADLYLWLDRPVKSYDGANHPYGNVGINRYAFNMLKPLIDAQPYINSCEEFKGQKVAVDLDIMRSHHTSTMPYGSITRWIGQTWPDMQGDDSLPWIFIDYDEENVKPIFKKCDNKIIINRTSRYLNPLAQYWFLRDFKHEIIFAGVESEHEQFCREWDFEVPLLKVQDFRQLSAAFSICKYFIGNQSFCFALAEAVKIKRLLEVCSFAPNVIPTGRHGYDFLHQTAFEWFVKDKESPLNK